MFSSSFAFWQIWKEKEAAEIFEGVFLFPREEESGNPTEKKRKKQSKQGIMQVQSGHKTWLYLQETNAILDKLFGTMTAP